MLPDLFAARLLLESFIAMDQDIQPILDKVLGGGRLTSEDCTALLESNDFVRIGLAAHEVRMRKNPTDIVTYIIDRNINYTNVCNVVCTFCAFYRRPGKPDTYVHSIEEICTRIDETIALGGTGVLMQGGCTRILISSGTRTFFPPSTRNTRIFSSIVFRRPRYTIFRSLAGSITRPLCGD